MTGRKDSDLFLTNTLREFNLGFSDAHTHTFELCGNEVISIKVNCLLKIDWTIEIMMDK